MRSWRRLSSTSISDHASWVRLRAVTSPLYVRTSQPTTTMTTTTRTTQPIRQPCYACLGVGAPSPSGLLKHLLVLVLAHRLAPLLDYRAQSNSLGFPANSRSHPASSWGRDTIDFLSGDTRRRGARESYRKLPAARSSLNSPSMYFTDAHEELRLHIRRFLEKEVKPHLEEWEEKTFPDSIFKRFGELGFLGLRYPPEYGGQGGDYFSAVVLSEELARIAAGGVGMAGGSPAVARREGDQFVVNGRKIFITNGARCHWALVVTKGDRERGHGGFNLLVIGKGTPGFPGNTPAP